MNPRRAWFLILAFVFANCTEAVTPDASDPADIVVEESKSVDEPLPERGPIDVPTDVWSMPALPTRNPSFPYLPGEDQSVSRSIGGVTEGWLVSGRALSFPHPRLAGLSVHAGRDLIYTTDRLADLVEKSALFVEKKFPGAVTYVGNFSAAGGGDIPYSVSHNSGRDCDIAFFMTDESGTPVEPPDLLPLDDEGKHVTESGDVYLFDAARNWSFIEGLLTEGRGVIQLVLVSAPLEKQVIAAAKKAGAKKSLVAAAANLMIQPSATLPHDDHFHLRIRCAEIDVASGCKSSAFANARKAVVTASKLSSAEPDPASRSNAFRRLALLNVKDSKLLEKGLGDASPIVRAAAARAMGDLRTGTKALQKRAKVEQVPEVFSEIVHALANIGSKSATNSLSKLLDKPRLGTFDAYDTIDQRLIVVDVLAESENSRAVEPLITLVSSGDKELADRAHRALKFLTNMDVTKKPAKIISMKVKSKKKKKKRRKKRKRNKRSKKKSKTIDVPLYKMDRGEAWVAWWKKNRKKKRTVWLVDGFKHAGYDVLKLDLKSLWDICKSIEGSDHISYNAQRRLMRMTGRRVDSLSWSKADAAFNWRRWFERRCGKRFKCPKIPPGMSTLKPKK